MVGIGDVTPNEVEKVPKAADAKRRGGGVVCLGALGLAGFLFLGGLGPLSMSASGEPGRLPAFGGGVSKAAAADVTVPLQGLAGQGASSLPSLQLAQASGHDASRVFVVQLASVTSEQEAEREWDQLKESFPDLLTDSQLLIERVELGGRGIFHRVQTGPFPDLGMAEKLCAQFKQRAQDCLVLQTSMTYPVAPEAAAAEEVRPAPAEVPPAATEAGSEELFEQFLQWRKQRLQDQPVE